MKSEYPNLRLNELGALAASANVNFNDNCIVSCVDWYGNSRPLFLNNRVHGGSPIFARADMRMIRELVRQDGLLKSNFGTLRGAGASPELMEYMEELLRKIGSAIDRIAVGGDDR